MKEVQMRQGASASILRGESVIHLPLFRVVDVTEDFPQVSLGKILLRYSGEGIGQVSIVEVQLGSWRNDFVRIGENIVSVKDCEDAARLLNVEPVWLAAELCRWSAGLVQCGQPVPMK